MAETDFAFDQAIIRLKGGKKLSRRGWAEKTGVAFVRYIPVDKEVAPAAIRRAYLEMITPHVYIVPWVVTQTDVLADDWFEVEGTPDYPVPTF
jgi:hypothetical protein